MKTSVTSSLVILVGSFVYPQSSRAASVSLTPVTGVGRLHGINQGDQIAGHSLGGDELKGFIYDHGNLTPINIQNGTGVQVYGIENNGRAVGKYYEYDPATKAVIKTHGFLYFHGGITNIDFPGANITVARGINDPQRVVGYYTGGDGHDHGFFFDKKSYTAIDVTNALDTYLTGINNPGDMVGYYTDPTADSNGDHHKHGFLYDKSGNVTTIDVQIPGVAVTDTFCYGINSSGVIVGAYVDDTGTTHGFVRINVLFLSVDVPLGIGTFVDGISDNGTVTVFGTTAFVGTVTP